MPSPTGEDAGKDAGASAGGDAGKSTRFDSESAREAARLRWARAAEKAPSSDDDDDDGPSDAAILRRLRRDAAKGSTQAVREVREWERHMASKGSTDQGFDVLWHELDPTQQEALLVRITKELCEELGIAYTDESLKDPHTQVRAPVTKGDTSPPSDEPLRA